MNKENIDLFEGKLFEKRNSNEVQKSFLHLETNFDKPNLILRERDENTSSKITQCSPISTNDESDINPFIIPDGEYANIISEFKLDTPSPNTFLQKKRQKMKKIPKLHDNKNNFIFYKNKQSQSHSKISILSYNILNQLFMKKYNRPDLSVDNRMKKIKNEILSLSPDIFCLQEADQYVYQKYFTSDKFAEYSTVYGVNCGSSFMNVVGFKKKKFILKSFKNFSLIFLGKMAGNRGVMNVQLEHEESNQFISIYNVHFPWKFEKDRYSIMTMIYEHIKEIEPIEKKPNVFIVGDLNSEPNSNVIKLLYFNDYLKEKDEENNNETALISNKLLLLSDFIFKNYKMKSAYQSYSKDDSKGTNKLMRHPHFTTRTQFYKKTIDYIFFSKNLKIHKILRLPSEEEVTNEKYLPSAKFPSDHLKLYAEFFVKKNNKKRIIFN